MAKVEYVDIVPGLENSYFSALRSGDRFSYSRIAKKIVLFSRKKKAGVSARSLLPAISALWDGLSDDDKTDWTNAAGQMGTLVDAGFLQLENGSEMLQENSWKLKLCKIKLGTLNGWRLFVQDTSARLKNDIAGVATPSLLHQSWVGNLHIEAPASEIKIVQLHPRSYWVSKKVTGKKGMYEPVLVTEDLALPFTISLNYKSELVSQGDGSFAKFYARFWYCYQGQNLFHDLEIPLDYSADWQNASAVLSTLLTYIVRVDLYFHLYNLRGDLYFDNIKAEHSGQNWVRDPFCLDILQGFTRAFYQIPDHWAAVTLPDGAQYDSIYKDF
jgi:hypothetical protein